MMDTMEQIESSLIKTQSELKELIDQDAYLRENCPDVVLIMSSNSIDDFYRRDGRTELVRMAVDSLRPEIGAFVEKFDGEVRNVLENYFARPVESNYFGSMVVLGEILAVWGRLFGGLHENDLFDQIRFASLVGGAYYKIVDQITDPKEVAIEAREDLYVGEILFLEFIRRLQVIDPDRSLSALIQASSSYVEINLMEKESRRTGTPMDLKGYEQTGRKLSPLLALLGSILHRSRRDDLFERYSEVIMLAAAATQTIDDLHDLAEDLGENGIVSPAARMVIESLGIDSRAEFTDEVLEKVELESMVGPTAFVALKRAKDYLRDAVQRVDVGDPTMRFIMLLRLWSLSRHLHRRQDILREAYSAMQEGGQA
ncbi:MAG: hypothetical protein QGG09_00400 [Pirellulaceae bacterium]|nr:hypothetical protein [Pirellulaceae bacterium]